MLIISSFMGWLASPLQGSIKGYAFPLFDNVSLNTGLTNPLQMISVGSILFAIGILGTFLLIYNKYLFFLGGIVVILCFGFIGNMVFLHPEILDSIADQNYQAQRIKSFSHDYLQGSTSKLKLYKDLTTDTLFGKIEIALLHLGIGWYIALIGSLIILMVTQINQLEKSIKGEAIKLILILFIVAMGISARPLIAEYNLAKGDYYLAQGEYQKAENFFQSALKWNSKLAHNSRYAHNLGAVCYRLNRLNCPEIHLYLGDTFMAVNEFSKAIHEYELISVMESGSSLANRKRVKALTMMGLNYYSIGNMYSAILNWQQALYLDPDQIQINFFLVKTFSDIDAHDQSKAIAKAQEVLEKTNDQLVMADTYNLLGDVYYKQKDLIMAREMYRRSRSQYQLVKKIINFDAMKGLQGI